ncbi:MAG: cyclic nucleotide-binding domain-containing protein [Phycisphaerales bacterium]|nr:cyclic nucleotide-binding domain-containing protein [Phycisphaerales bacterium]
MPIARAITRSSELLQRGKCATITRQGTADDDIYFILAGSVSVQVNGRQVAIRGQGEHFGEMAAIDPTMLRSATIKTLEETVIARLRGSVFLEIAKRFPDLWKNATVTLARRLREREKFHRPPRSQPVVFIGSSTEGLDVAEGVRSFFSRRECVPKLWSEGVFECSQTTIESLTGLARECDFAILVLTADDMTVSRRRERPAPRDNIVFELGLFMGAIGRDRTYVLAQDNPALRVPSDLLGVTRLHFSRDSKRKSRASMRRAMHALWAKIVKHGPI